MKNLKIWLLLLAFPFVTRAQGLEGDRISTDKGDLIIKPILHGTLVLQWDNKIIYVDPYGGGDVFAGVPSADLILITDIHGDHHNPETLAAIETADVQMVVPQAVKDVMEQDYKTKILANGQKWTWNGISIEAIPMYNLPEDADSRHTKGRGNGYILTMGGRRVYISGDTEDIPEMRKLKKIDVAFVCMNLPYTMDINQAADAVLDFKPAIVYPFHFRGQGGLADVEAFKKMVVDKNDKIEVRLRQWYPEG